MYRKQWDKIPHILYLGSRVTNTHGMRGMKGKTSISTTNRNWTPVIQAISATNRNWISVILPVPHHFAKWANKGCYYSSNDSIFNFSIIATISLCSLLRMERQAYDVCVTACMDMCVCVCVCICPPNNNWTNLPISVELSMNVMILAGILPS